MKILKIERQKISYSFIFSIAIHFCFLAFMVKVNNEGHFVSSNEKLLAAAKLADKGSFDSVKIISKKQLQAIKDSMNKQVVANEANGKAERPVDSRFFRRKRPDF